MLVRITSFLALPATAIAEGNIFITSPSVKQSAKGL